MAEGRKYTNGEITIYWSPRECIHSAMCFMNLRSVFDPMKRPWIDPQGASSARIRETIEKCPSGALKFRWNDPSRNEKESSPKCVNESVHDAVPREILPDAAEAVVCFMPDGPMIVRGDFRAVGPNGKPMALDYDRRMTGVAFCRCGLSAGKPYCDGSHANGK